MCDLVAQSLIFGLVNGIFNYGSIYLLCDNDPNNRSPHCPDPADVNVMNFIYGFLAMFVLYFAIMWITREFFENNTAMKILLLVMIAVFGVLLYMNYIGKPQNISLLSLVVMMAVSYLIFGAFTLISQWLGDLVCNQGVDYINAKFPSILNRKV